MAWRGSDATYLANELKAFSRANVPFPSIFDFGEYPWLDECAPCDHNTVYARGFYFFPVVLGGETVAATKNGDGDH